MDIEIRWEVIYIIATNKRMAFAAKNLCTNLSKLLIHGFKKKVYNKSNNRGDLEACEY